MNRGIEVGIYLRPGLDEEDFIASALGNLAAWKLAASREERLDWQVLRVDGSGRHHYRLVVRHPERLLDLGVRTDLVHILDGLSNEDVTKLRHRLSTAKTEGLHTVGLRRVHEQPDLWQDDFWNSIG
ncbi:hypothetical protein B2A_14550 [mine drainage metagenome]|uniref:Uncharacterized protein n=1 Tax=mine drainage metagenome TaxID=410659 RepID=T0Y837_9ZZZZ